MPCSDSSSSISLKLTPDEKFISFEYAKITCGQEISADTGLNKYLKKKDLTEILQIPFQTIQDDLMPSNEEAQFVLYSEWDALRSAIGQFLGINDPNIDVDRCQITSIDYTERGIEIAEVILPPKELPKILPCSLAKQNQNQN